MKGKRTRLAEVTRHAEVIVGIVIEMQELLEAKYFN